MIKKMGRVLLLTCLSTTPSLGTDVSEDLLEHLRSRPGRMDPHLRQSISFNGMGDFRFAPHEEVSRHGLQTVYNVDPGERRNQQASGRCWIFAAFKALGEEMRQEYGQDFEFSHSHVLFWDKYERALFYLQSRYELAKKHSLGNPAITQYLDAMVSGDGGDFEFLRNVVKKYGLVPAKKMRNTTFTNNTGPVNSELQDHLKQVGIKIHTIVESGDPRTDEKVQALINTAKQEIYDMLTGYFGKPIHPDEEFSWVQPLKAEEEDDKGDLKSKAMKIFMEMLAKKTSGAEAMEEDTGSEPASKKRKHEEVEGEEEEEEEPGAKRVVKTFTPLGFAKFAKVNVDDWVQIAHIPYVKSEEDGNYAEHSIFEVDGCSNMVGGENYQAFLVSMEEMKRIARDSIKAGHGMEFGGEMKYVVEGKVGKSLVSADYDLERSIFKFHEFAHEKGDRLKARIDEFAHALYLNGCDEEDSCAHTYGPEEECALGYGPLWRLRNSWGSHGKDLYLTDRWFDEYAHTIVVRKQFLGEELLAAYETAPRIHANLSDPAGKITKK